MTDLIPFERNQNRKRKVFLFTDALRRSGKYPEMIIDRLEAHLDQGSIECVVDNIFNEEPISNIKIIISILLEYGFHSFD